MNKTLKQLEYEHLNTLDDNIDLIIENIENLIKEWLTQKRQELRDLAKKYPETALICEHDIAIYNELLEELQQ